MVYRTVIAWPGSFRKSQRRREPANTSSPGKEGSHIGYTHYWRRPKELDKNTFKLWSNDVSKLVLAAAETGVKIVDGLGENPEPIITPEEVYLNGDPAHETFGIARLYTMEIDPNSPNGLQFEFCKTAQKPYDIVVTAALVAFKMRFGDAVRVSSDGDNNDWRPGIDLADSILGTEQSWAFDQNSDLQHIPD